MPSACFTQATTKTKNSEAVEDVAIGHNVETVAQTFEEAEIAYG